MMFASDYFTARESFRRMAAGRATQLPLSASGPQGEPLSTDVVWLGDPHARRVLIVTSGLHGIEGFAGSAVQCALLGTPPQIPHGCALALVHALNPWGFAHLRRVNENNVDLNRNFLRSGEQYRGASGLYRRMDAFLNPPSPPRSDGFYLHALQHALRHGVGSCRQAIAEGQYEFDRGLFFGGRELEQGPSLFLTWLERACGHAEQLLVLDLHTGLGRFAGHTLLAEPFMTLQHVAQLERRLQTRVEGGDGSVDAAGFAARGSMGSKLPEVLPRASVQSVTVEFGTLSGVRMLRALREENRWHHHGAATLAHGSKRQLLRAFSPESAAWRGAVLTAGRTLVQRAVAEIAAE